MNDTVWLVRWEFVPSRDKRWNGVNGPTFERSEIPDEGWQTGRVIFADETKARSRHSKLVAADDDGMLVRNVELARAEPEWEWL